MNIFIAFQLILCILLLQYYYSSVSANQSFKLEIEFNIDGHKQKVTMNETMTKDFIGKMKNIVDKVPKIDKECEKIKNYAKSSKTAVKVPNNNDKCERFIINKDKNTKIVAIESISNMLEGKEKIDASNHCFHNWVPNFILAEISKEILAKLKAVKNKEIYQRILGNLEGQKKFTSELDHFLQEFEIDEKSKMRRGVVNLENIQEKFDLMEFARLHLNNEKREKSDAEKFNEIFENFNHEGGLIVNLEIDGNKIVEEWNKPSSSSSTNLRETNEVIKINSHVQHPSRSRDKKMKNTAAEPSSLSNKSFMSRSSVLDPRERPLSYLLTHQQYLSRSQNEKSTNIRHESPST